jgi:hypothetical protein
MHEARGLIPSKQERKVSQLCSTQCIHLQYLGLFLPLLGQEVVLPIKLSTRAERQDREGLSSSLQALSEGVSERPVALANLT